MENSAEIFEQYRPELFRLAYSILERITAAEDAVQEAFIRWQKQDLEQIRSHRSYLSSIVSHLCLDELKSAKSRREQYIGPDLPEPVLTAEDKNPQEKVELAESLSMALLVVLEELTPVQRTVFMLREVFDYDYASVAEIANKSEPHCRKIAQRAREKVRDKRPSFEEKTTDQHELVAAFIEAVQAGDITEIEQMLAKEAVLYSDGGGKVTAARKPVAGAVKIAKFLVGIQKQGPKDAEWWIEFKDINGEPGMIIWLEGEVYNVWSFHIEGDNIQNIFVVLNPEKLDHFKRDIPK